MGELRGDTLRWLTRFEPCGQENPVPVFVSRNVLVAKSWTVGADGRHLRLKLREGPVAWEAVAFDLGPQAPRAGERIDLLYSVAEDRRGFGLELQVKDFAPAGGG
ncbi:MAG: hypothetical protein U0531_12970 [Dehalococcoidia bacterium]